MTKVERILTIVTGILAIITMFTALGIFIFAPDVFPVFIVNALTYGICYILAVMIILLWDKNRTSKKNKESTSNS